MPTKKRIVKPAKKKKVIKKSGYKGLIGFLVATALIVGSFYFMAREYGKGPFTNLLATTIGVKRIPANVDDGTLRAVVPDINAISGTTCLTDCLSKGTPASTCGSRCAGAAAVASSAPQVDKPAEITTIICSKGWHVNTAKTGCVKDPAPKDGEPVEPVVPVAPKLLTDDDCKKAGQGFILDKATNTCKLAPVVVPPPAPPVVTVVPSSVICEGINGSKFQVGAVVVGPLLPNSTENSLRYCKADGSWGMKYCGFDEKSKTDIPCTEDKNGSMVTVKPTYQILNETPAGTQPKYNCIGKGGEIYPNGTRIAADKTICSSGKLIPENDYYKEQETNCKSEGGNEWISATHTCLQKKFAGTAVTYANQCASGKVKIVDNKRICIDETDCKASCSSGVLKSCVNNILTTTTCKAGCNTAGIGCNPEVVVPPVTTTTMKNSFFGCASGPNNTAISIEYKSDGTKKTITCGSLGCDPKTGYCADGPIPATARTTEPSNEIVVGSKDSTFACSISNSSIEYKSDGSNKITRCETLGCDPKTGKCKVGSVQTPPTSANAQTTPQNSAEGKSFYGSTDGTGKTSWELCKEKITDGYRCVEAGAVIATGAKIYKLEKIPVAVVVAPQPTLPNAAEGEVFNNSPESFGKSAKQLCEEKITTGYECVPAGFDNGKLKYKLVEISTTTPPSPTNSDSPNLFTPEVINNALCVSATVPNPTLRSICSSLLANQVAIAVKPQTTSATGSVDPEANSDSYVTADIVSIGCTMLGLINSTAGKACHISNSASQSVSNYVITNPGAVEQIKNANPSTIGAGVGLVSGLRCMPLLISPLIGAFPACVTGGIIVGSVAGSVIEDVTNNNDGVPAGLDTTPLSR